MPRGSRFGPLGKKLVIVGNAQHGALRLRVVELIPTQTLDQAREAAIADARRKAEVYAQASSLQLRRVEWITEDAGFTPPGPMRAQHRCRWRCQCQ